MPNRFCQEQGCGPDTASAPCRRCGILEGIDLPALASAGLVTHRKFAKRQILFHEHEPCRGPFFLCSGSVKLYLKLADERRQIVRLVVGGELFGLAHVLAETPNAYTAETLEPCEMMMFEPERFTALALQNPSLCGRLLRYLAAELGRAREVQKELSFKTGRQRVARILLRLGKDYGRESARGVRIEIPVSRSDLADLAAMAPETLIRILSEFKERKLLYTTGKSISIIDSPALRDMTE